MLQGSPDLEGADVALLCKAPPAPADVHALGEGRTIGLEAPLLPDRPVDRPWSTAVAWPHPLGPITDARVARPFKDRPRLPFEPSRPGTWTAASVEIDGLNVTAISLYGLMDERSDASVHRSLSALSPIFDHEEYGKHLLLAATSTSSRTRAGRPRPRPPSARPEADRGVRAGRLPRAGAPLARFGGRRARRVPVRAG